MNAKNQSMHLSDHKQRKSMSLPRKSLIEAKFSNERLNGALKISQDVTPSSVPSLQSNHRKTFSFIVSPKQRISKNVLLSFDDFVSTRRSTLRKILKHNSIKASKQMKTEASMLGGFSFLRPKSHFVTEIDQTTFQMKKCLQMSNQSYIRKNYH